MLIIKKKRGRFEIQRETPIEIQRKPCWSEWTLWWPFLASLQSKWIRRDHPSCLSESDQLPCTPPDSWNTGRTAKGQSRKGDRADLVLWLHADWWCNCLKQFSGLILCPLVLLLTFCPEEIAVAKFRRTSRQLGSHSAIMRNKELAALKETNMSCITTWLNMSPWSPKYYWSLHPFIGGLPT